MCHQVQHASPRFPTVTTTANLAPMDEQNDRGYRPSASTWVLLIGVFLGAVAITLVLGTSSDPVETTFPDLGDLTAQDPNVPGNHDAAPTFALQTILGDTFDLESHITEKDMPVVLNLWASWCAPCRAEMPAIDTAAKRHPEVQFVGVAVQDDADKALSFAEEIGVSYTLAIDDGTVEEAYPVLGLPATFFIDSDGIIVKRHFGVVTTESLADDIAELFGG